MSEANLEQYYPKVVAASIDICGLKNLVDREDKCKSAMKAIELLVINVFRQRGAYKDPSFKENPDFFLYDFGRYFGDSVYLFADPKLDIVTQIQRLTISCASLLATGFVFGFIARAGIAVGDLSRKVIDFGGDIKQELRIGSCMIRAHQLQECQRWIGGAVETDSPINDSYRFEYEVPVKADSEYKDHKLQAINWIDILKEFRPSKANVETYQDKNKIIDKVRKEIKEVNGDNKEELEIRLENTIKFIEYVFSESKFNYK